MSNVIRLHDHIRQKDAQHLHCIRCDSTAFELTLNAGKNIVCIACKEIFPVAEWVFDVDVSEDIAEDLEGGIHNG